MHSTDASGVVMHTEVDEINRVFKSRSRFHSGRVVNLTLIPGKSVLRIRLEKKKGIRLRILVQVVLSITF